MNKMMSLVYFMSMGLNLTYLCFLSLLCTIENGGGRRNEMRFSCMPQLPKGLIHLVPDF